MYIPTACVWSEEAFDMDVKLVCRKCDAALALKKVVFEYLGSNFTYDLPCCPKCGDVFISAALAEGKIAEVEQLLEDK